MSQWHDLSQYALNYNNRVGIVKCNFGSKFNAINPDSIAWTKPPMTHLVGVHRIQLSWRYVRTTIPPQFWCTWRGLEDGVDARQCCSYHCFHGISDEKKTFIKIRLDVPRQSQWHDKQGVSLSHKVGAIQRQEPKNIVSWLIFHGAMKIKLKVVKPSKMGQI